MLIAGPLRAGLQDFAPVLLPDLHATLLHVAKYIEVSLEALRYQSNQVLLGLD